MSAVVIGAAIVAFAALKAGPALWALTGREWNRILPWAWPVGLWLVALALLFVLIPRSPLLEDAQGTTTLIAACIAVSLVYAVPLAWQGWRWWRHGRTASSSHSS